MTIPRSGLRVLFTNNTLSTRTGSELYVRDVALALLRRGHLPMAYSTVLGEVAEELRKATIPVVDDLAALNVAPDLIHGQHHLDAMTAMLRFPHVPALYVCHGWMPWEEHPPLFPTIERYLAVDDVCRERLLTTQGIAADKVAVLYNFVDLDRFHVGPELPAAPRAALIFSNYATESNFIGSIRAACLRQGIERVDVVGARAGHPVAEPESVLGDYQIVFAKGHCALEAMAAGCAVIVADFSGLGGIVTSENVERLRRLNFGVRTMQAGPITEDSVGTQLQRYCRQDARMVTQWIRNEAGLNSATDRLLEIYAQVLNAPRTFENAGFEAPCVAASRYLRFLSDTYKTRDIVAARAHEAEATLAQTTAGLDHTRDELQHTRDELQHIRRELERTATALRQAEDRVETAARALAAIHGSRAWQAVSWYRRFRSRWLGRWTA